MLKGPFLDRNFIGSIDDYKSANIVLLGMPYDCTCTNRAGARFAPQQIRVESVGIETYSPYFDVDICDLKFYDAGDLEFPFGNASKMLEIVQDNVDCIYSDNKKLLGIGGEHLVTLGSVKSLIKHYKNLAVIQFDAHCDLRSQYLSEPLTHSGVMYQISQLIGFDNIAQIGIRSGEKEEFSLMKKYKTQKFSPEELSKFKDKEIFVTIDLDVFDPSLVSGVGTPEAGGFSYIQLIEYLKYLKGFNIVGIDIVELAPDIDATKCSTACACKLIREVLSLL